MSLHEELGGLSSFSNKDSLLVGIEEAIIIGKLFKELQLFQQKILIVASPFIRCLKTIFKIMGKKSWPNVPTIIQPLCAETTPDKSYKGQEHSIQTTTLYNP